MVKKQDGRELLRKFFDTPGNSTQASFARQAGMVPQQLSPILAGRRRPTLQQAIWIKRLAGIPIEAWES